MLPRVRLSDHKLGSLSSKNREVSRVRVEIAVDLPAVREIWVVFEWSHRRIGIDKFHDVSRPLSQITVVRGNCGCSRQRA